MKYILCFIKQIEDEEKEFVAQEVEKAKQDPEVPMSELLQHVYLHNDQCTFLS